MAPGPTIHRLAMVLVVLAFAAGLIALRTLATDRHVAGDTFWYARQAARIAGATDDGATMAAAAFMTEQRGDDPAYWNDLVQEMDPRYPAIFEARPLYPLTAALMIPFIGLDALLVASAIAGLACAALLALATQQLWSSTIAGLVAGIAVVLLPAGEWFAFAYADAVMLATWAATLLIGGHHLLHGGRASGFGFGIALIATTLAKSANGFVLTIAVVVVAGVMVVQRSGSRRRAMGLAALASALTAAFLLVSPLIGYSGVSESLQDLATHHFRDPDVRDPIGELLRRDRVLLDHAAGMIGDALIPIFVALVGLASLALRGSVSALLWIVAGFGSFLLVMLHPVTSEIPRLLAPIWLSASIGLGGLAATAAARLSANGNGSRDGVPV